VLTYLPKYFTSKATSLYIGVLVLCNILFFNRFLSPLWWVFGLVEVISFFYFSNKLTRQWADYSEKKFAKKLFQNALIIRIIWVIFSYFFFIYMTGNPFEYDAGDSIGYHREASQLAAMMHEGNIQPWFRMVDMMKHGFSDMGYVFYLGCQYFVTDSSIFIERLFKALFSAFTCILIYRLAKRTFGEAVGRMSAIFCMLMPNLILYCGLHEKEVEMVFLAVLFMERVDALVRLRNFNIINIALPILITIALFSFRTVLGVTALFALFTTLMFSTSKILGMGKRMILIIWVLVAAGYFIGGTIANEVENTWNDRNINQEQSLEFRATRENGNKFAKFAGGAVFAPMIFVIPFPTIIETPGQQNQKIINGGNYVKNIMAFFAIFALYWVIKNKKWRDYLLIGSFLIGYLGIIAVSAFAQSERFHQPVLPFELAMAAFGLSLVTNREKKYFTWWTALIFIAIVGWSWFKLAGRNMV